MNLLNLIKHVFIRVFCFSLIIVFIGIAFANYSTQDGSRTKLTENSLQNATEINENLTTLISILQKVSRIADEFPFNKKEYLRHEIISLVSKVNTDILRIQFPSEMPTLSVKVLAGNVFTNPTKFECSVFVFPKTGNKLPLHDHPNMEGFIKALKGKLMITSFSLLDSEEEEKLRNERLEVRNERPARFEGRHFLDASESAEVVNLNTLTGNIHSIESTDGIGAFFDILIPGYHQADGIVPCTFFETEESNYTVGNVYWLKVIPTNEILNLVSMGKLELPNIEKID